VTTARKTDPIRKIPTKNGRPGTASSSTWASGETACDQRCHTFSKLGKARAARVKIIADRGRGVLVKPTKIMVADAIRTWLDGRRNLRPSTQRGSADSLRTRVGPARPHSAFRRPPRHLDKLVTELLASGCRIATFSAAGV
jgi:hypothetical protein